uniref:small ribosomal subunit biogenesis GTPase RsgA 1, mitochondrial n=1 Tax=Erigeron canadensis TaxID=72917 RepID=UPI001CB8E6D5|nr:small ribosomal subunit biogenesis GTPase RsgA 1, mitochondrial [Erigeron canadensis]
MTSLSISLFRHHHHHAPLISYAVHRRFSTFRSVSVIASRNRENLSKKSQQPSKHLLKARDSVKHFSSLSPSLSPPITSADNLHLSPDQAIGKVASAQANFMRVVVEPEKILSENEGNGVELLCVVRNLLKKIKRRVLVGDKVLVGSIDWTDRRGMIENVFERKTEVLDPPVANVDHLLVLFSLDQPKLEEFSLTRFLVEAESTRIPVTLALNKAELVDKETVISWKSKLRSWGYEPVFCSVETKTGLDTLQFNLRDQTSVIVGPSGVGKSSLINAMRSNQFGFGAAEVDDWSNSILGSKWLEDQRVGEVSARSGRGKHTTRHVSLLPLSGGGYVADTPGFNQPSLLKVTKQSLALCFPEVRKILSASEPLKCAFSNCLHLGEPGCLVKTDWERYPYYFQLLDEIKIREEFQLRTLGTKRESDVRYKAGDMGIMQAEPRLQPKKHRRTSRKKMNQSFLDDVEAELEGDEDESFLEDDPIIKAMENDNQ